MDFPEGVIFKAGRIKFELAKDRADDSARLRIEVQDGSGARIGEVEIVADNLTSYEDRQAVALFAFNVDEARRKARYIQSFENRERVLNEIREDFYEWTFRQRGDRERWEGLGDDAVRNAKMQR